MQMGHMSSSASVGTGPLATIGAASFVGDGLFGLRGTSLRSCVAASSTVCMFRRLLVFRSGLELERTVRFSDNNTREPPSRRVQCRCVSVTTNLVVGCTRGRVESPSPSTTGSSVLEWTESTSSTAAAIPSTTPAAAAPSAPTSEPGRREPRMRVMVMMMRMVTPTRAPALGLASGYLGCLGRHDSV